MGFGGSLLEGGLLGSALRGGPLPVPAAVLARARAASLLVGIGRDDDFLFSGGGAWDLDLRLFLDELLLLLRLLGESPFNPRRAGRPDDEPIHNIPKRKTGRTFYHNILTQRTHGMCNTSWNVPWDLTLWCPSGESLGLPSCLMESGGGDFIIFTFPHPLPSSAEASGVLVVELTDMRLGVRDRAETLILSVEGKTCLRCLCSTNIPVPSSCV